jgi:hypothetical protein
MVRLTNPAIDDIEDALSDTLPGLYRNLLVEEGYGAFGSDAEIYHPLHISDMYGSFFEDPMQLFNSYVPFGYNSRTQELWVINPKIEVAASIWHETVPEDWVDEEWLPYDEWVMRYLDPLFGDE